jgi:hypothetical protein
MAFFAVIKNRKRKPVEALGPFVTRKQAKDWMAGVVMEYPDGTAEFLQENHTVSFYKVDDYVAFGAEVN